MLFSQAAGHKVVSTTTAETVGKLDDYVIDPSGPTVAALKVKKGDGDTLRWADILAFGTDAVTVESAEKITKGAGDELAPLLEKRNQMHKKLVLSTTGDALGAVKDIDFDPATGRVVTLVLDTGDIEAKRLVGVGSYAIVVESDTAAPSGSTSAAPSEPAQAPPVDAPPVEAPPVEAPPVEAPPVEAPPVDAPPVEAPPVAAPSAQAATSLDLNPSEPGLVLEPPDLSHAERATYPPGE